VTILIIHFAGGLASYDMKLHVLSSVSPTTSPPNGAVAAMHHVSALVSRLGCCFDARFVISENSGSTVLCLEYLRLINSSKNQIGILERLSLTIHSASAQETSKMDTRAPAGQQMSSQPLSGDWSSGPVQTQQGPNRPAQQATQAIPGTSRPKTTFVFATVNRQGPEEIFLQAHLLPQAPSYCQHLSSSSLSSHISSLQVLSRTQHMVSQAQANRSTKTSRNGQGMITPRKALHLPHLRRHRQR